MLSGQNFLESLEKQMKKQQLAQNKLDGKMVKIMSKGAGGAKNRINLTTIAPELDLTEMNISAVSQK